jgi:hypothetical protein
MTMAKCDDYPTGMAALRAWLGDDDGPARLSRDAVNRAVDEHHALIRCLREILASGSAKDVFNKLARGQGTNTDEGRAWLAAKALLEKHDRSSETH